MNDILLNDNEKKVLQLCINEVVECTGNEFGYMEDVKRGEFTKAQFAGYVSQLSQKNIFGYINNTYNGQFAIRKEFFNQSAF